MGLFSFNSEHAQTYEEVQNASHKGSLTHEAFVAWAAYEADKKYNEYCDKHGKPQSHEKAKEIWEAPSAGLLGGIVDHYAETKGASWFDKEKVQWEAHQAVSEHIAKDY